MIANIRGETRRLDQDNRSYRRSRFWLHNLLPLWEGKQPEGQRGSGGEAGENMGAETRVID